MVVFIKSIFTHFHLNDLKKLFLQYSFGFSNSPGELSIENLAPC